jgi:peptide/nickel transport system permease protein
VSDGARNSASAEPAWSAESHPGRFPALSSKWTRRLVRGGRSRAVGAVMHALSVTAIVVVITFALVRIVPGDPVVSIEGINSTPQARAAMRAQLHLNKPVLEQFELYVRALFNGDLGDSLIQQGRPVSKIISGSLPVTLALIAATLVVSVLLGVPLGLLAALGGELVDFTVRSLMTVLLALPPFFLGLILILFVSVREGALPAGGWGTSAFGDVRFLVLPALALAGFLAPLIVRVARQAAAHALHEQWIEVAIARGISRRRIVVSHLLPNTLLPVITLVGYNVGALLTGAVVVESVFALPGIGQELVNAINTRDYPVIQGIALISALVVVAANLLADLLSNVVDPRTRSA